MKGRELVMLALALAVSACQTQIQHELSEREANEIQTVLIERGFDARKVRQKGKKPTWNIEVGDDQAVDAVRVLAELELPRAKAPTTLEVLGSGGFVPSPAEERARQTAGLSGDVAQTLETVDGVVSARVHLVIPQPPRGLQPAGAPKASAFLRVRPGAGARVLALREELRALIAASVEGLTPEGVTVVVDEVSTNVQAPARPAASNARVKVALLGVGLLLTVIAASLAVVLVRMRARADRAPAVRREVTSVHRGLKSVAGKVA